MPVRIDDHSVQAAADAVLAAAQTLTDASGMRIHVAMTKQQALSAVMGAIVGCSGLHYASAIQPTGWVEFNAENFSLVGGSVA